MLSLNKMHFPNYTAALKKMADISNMNLPSFEPDLFSLPSSAAIIL
jgi:hypothetical protein